MNGIHYRIMLGALMFGMATVTFAQVDADRQQNNIPEKHRLWTKSWKVIEQYHTLHQKVVTINQLNQQWLQQQPKHEMVAPQTLRHRIRAFKKQYGRLPLSAQFSLSIDSVKAAPMGPKETRILKEMPHITTHLDSQLQSDRGLGITFTYQLD